MHVQGEGVRVLLEGCAKVQMLCGGEGQLILCEGLDVCAGVCGCVEWKCCVRRVCEGVSIEGECFMAKGCEKCSVER